MDIDARDAGGMVRLPGGRAVIWRRFTASKFGESGAFADLPVEVVSLGIEVDDRGRPRCTGIEVRARAGAAVTGDALRLPVGRLIREVVAGTAEKVESSAPGIIKTAPFSMPIDERAELYEELIRQPRRGAPLTDRDLIQVARIYRAAMERGDPPTKMLADRMKVGRATASRWIKRARNDGHLGEAIPGRAGEAA